MVQRRVNWISQQRVNLDDLRAIESAGSNDFDQLIQGLVTNTTQGYIVRGFEISMTNAIGGAANSLQVVVDPGSVLHILASQSGTVLMVPPGTAAQQLNGATNPNVVGSFSPNSINYVGLDYTRYLDATTTAQVYIWDPTTNSETTETAPRADILTYQLVVSTSSWPSNVLPIATVTTDSGNNVTSITDARWLLNRLGTGGANPNPQYVYPWTAQSEGRVENPSTSTSNSINPFEGGDKMLFSLKDWMNAIMSILLELKGTPYWYSGIFGSGSMVSLREDTALTVITGNSSITNGILPNSVPVLTTTGNTHSNNQLDGLASTTGLVNGLIIMGSGIPAGTTIINIVSGVITMSQSAVTSLTGTTVTFYAPEQITVPGQINWASSPPGDGQIYLKLIGSELSYQIVENPTGSTVTLADNEAAYITLVRNVPIAPNLFFTPYPTAPATIPNTTVVQSIGSISWTTGLQAGDWIRAALDSDANYYEIRSVDSTSQVTLTGLYTPASQTAAGVQSVYAYGTYTLPGQTGGPRDIILADRASVPLAANTVWLFLRSDDGGSVSRVYIKYLDQEIQTGDQVEIAGLQLNNVLQYIGSPIESATAPNYTAQVSPGAVPEITSITTGDASTMASNQYFYIYSAADSRKYYVWVNKDGTGVDPMPLSEYIGVPWPISTGQTSTQTASALVVALNSLSPNDFLASQVTNTVTVTNRSAGTANATTNYNVGAPFSVLTVQVGTGQGNFIVNDGDNLTLAIKKLDDALGFLEASLNNPDYDENISIVASGGASPPYAGGGFPNFTPVLLNGPIAASTQITLPKNTRLSNLQAYYSVGQGALEVYLNGQYLELGVDWLEVGAISSPSDVIETLQALAVGDTLEFRTAAGGGGGGGGGGEGPPGPQGPAGPPGADAAGGPVAISTKTSTYTVLSSDCFLKANCSSANITFYLPSAASENGNIFYFKKIDSTTNIMTIQAFGSDLIDGLASLSTNTQWQAFSLISDGTTWSIF